MVGLDVAALSVVDEFSNEEHVHIAVTNERFEGVSVVNGEVIIGTLSAWEVLRDVDSQLIMV